jgi:glucose/arabinose dehydrogenase
MHRLLPRLGGLFAVGALGIATLGACGTEGPTPPAAPTRGAGPANHVAVERTVTGLDRPTYVGAAPGDPDGLWVLEQTGRVVRLEGEERVVALDLSDRLVAGSEQGLLGLAFHPRFASNGLLYLHWTDASGGTRVAEFVAADRRAIDPEPVRELLAIEQPEENHNGGQLAFGPDGRLYLGLGDGGGAFDPRRTAQDQASLLGKVVALDVDAPGGAVGAAAWQVVLSGLRNPWRFSFDAALGEVWVADVGQDQVEEVNRVLLEPDEPPKNLGWSAYEGTARLADHELDASGELVFPVATYGHDEGCSIIGGHVYQGTALEPLVRRYVYGDFCSGSLWSLRGTAEGGATDVRQERAKVPQLTHIGLDGDGELVFASASGAIYRAIAPHA